MIKESKHCSREMKKHFNKELVLTKEDDENFESCRKCWICDNTFNAGDAKERNYCHVARKERDAAYRDCDIKTSI